MHRSKENKEARLCTAGKHPWIEAQRLCEPCRSDRQRRNYERLPLEQQFHFKLYKAECRAKKRGEYFDLTLEQLIFVWNEQAGRCALTGVEMTLRSGEGWKPTSVSIDKINANEVTQKGMLDSFVI